MDGQLLCRGGIVSVVARTIVNDPEPTPSQPVADTSCAAYPGDLVLITKIDLAPATGFDVEQALATIETVRPGVQVIETSVRTSLGMAAWLEWLESRVWSGGAEHLASRA